MDHPNRGLVVELLNKGSLWGVLRTHRTMDEMTEALRVAVDDQMKNGTTTFIEALINQELGEPFRRDAMKAPVVVAGIDPTDMADVQPA